MTTIAWLILLRHEQHPSGLDVYAYLNELTHHAYSIGYFPSAGGWMILDSGVVPVGGLPGVPHPIPLPGQPGKVYGSFATHEEALAALEAHDATLDEPVIGRHKPGFRPQHIQR